MIELLLPLSASLLLPLITAPLGCIVVWRRMAYFSDSIAHAALFGVAIGMVFSFSPMLGIIGSALLLAAILGWMEKEQRISLDAMLGVITHAILAIGLLLMEWIARAEEGHGHQEHHGHDHGQKAIDMHSILIGDITNITSTDIGIMLGLWLVIAVILRIIWQDLMLVTLHAPLAQSEGVNVLRIRQTSMLLVALGVAATVQIVGVLLVTALLIIPASAARFISQTPLSMLRYSAIIGLISTVLGTFLALEYQLSAGPVIVLLSFIGWLGCYMGGKR